MNEKAAYIKFQIGIYKDQLTSIDKHLEYWKRQRQRRLNSIKKKEQELVMYE